MKTAYYFTKEVLFSADVLSMIVMVAAWYHCFAGMIGL
jgi:hypothetical protein